MTDTTLIWQAMNIIVTDSHPAIYQFIKGQSKSKDSAIMRVTELTYNIFSGVFDIAEVRGVAREFLTMKGKEYMNGHIKIKCIY